ncbi:hypothetical protein ABZ642_26115 [Streptomyces sp. NPDC007157]|uniref:hypothetical protein n=1 Tax=Streptomyces sp. NPDC007157 TaxID=3154681 RepID=UPI0033F03D4F
MRERPGSGDQTSAGEEVKGSSKRIDLSVPQVAGSAVAAVVAAKLASYAGVYGTILGAGVVSVIATCGGTLFQHFFKHTGEQLRDATVAPRLQEQAPPAPGEFTAGTVYRARVRTWRRPVFAAALVFVVAMAGVTTYELVSGSSFSGGSGTTVSGAVTGDTGSSKSSAPADPADPSGSADPNSVEGTGTSPTPTPTPSPPSSSDASRTPASGGATTPAPSPSESASGEPSTAPSPAGPPATDPEPSASSRSGTAGPDRADPAVR